jgi:predicted HicB family RNase H-like nuclease
MDILKYKDYEGTAELDMTRGVCRGKILFITDLVTYEAALPTQLQSEFEAAVDDYLLTCEELQREPKKPLKGQFNVRISPELHRDATLRAFRDATSLNEVVVRALDAYLNGQDVNHVETKNYFVSPSNMHEIFATTSTPAAHLFVAGGTATIGAGNFMAGTGGRHHAGSKH